MKIGDTFSRLTAKGKGKLPEDELLTFQKTKTEKLLKKLIILKADS